MNNILLHLKHIIKALQLHTSELERRIIALEQKDKVSSLLSEAPRRASFALRAAAERSESSDETKGWYGNVKENK